MRWIIKTYPIFMYCAICSHTIFYPLSRFLFKTNFCFHCGIKLLYKQVLRKNIFCNHKWIWIGCASGSSVAYHKEREKRLSFSIDFHTFNPDRVTNWDVCKKCGRTKKTVSSLKYARALKKLAQKIADDAVGV